MTRRRIQHLCNLVAYTSIQIMNHTERIPTTFRPDRRSPFPRPLGTIFATAAVLALALSGCTQAQSGSSSAASAAATTTEVAQVSPTQAGVSQEPTVTLEGDGLDNVDTVKFGTADARIRKVEGSDKLVVVAPSATNYAPATVDITLLNADGKPVAKKKDAFKYTVKSGVDKQLTYALAHWNKFNTSQYGDLNPVGGDCANFVSQTLIQRGWKMNDQWYNHDAAADWSPAWGYVPAMDAYFADNAKKLGLQKLGFDDRSKVALGDIAIFDWDDDGSYDHVQVVTRIIKSGKTTKIEMASHNDNYDFRDLDKTITTQHPGATGHFWHLTR